MPLLGLTTPFPFPPPSRLPNLRPTTAKSTATPSSSPVQFHYPQADPFIRWPNLHRHLPHLPPPKQPPITYPKPISSPIPPSSDEFTSEEANSPHNFESLESKANRTPVKKISMLALKRVSDWRCRVNLLSDRILSLPESDLVADVLDHTESTLQVGPAELSFVVSQVGQTNWQRALEAFQWSTLHHGHAPGPRLLSAMLSILGRARQYSLAEEIFVKSCSDAESKPTVQVYNSMMGVYARTGQFNKVRALLDSMRDRELEPDLVSFNTLINARAKSGISIPDSALDLLAEVHRSGLTPDTITYNTLLNTCSKNSNLEDAMKVFDKMLASKCNPDLCTYNTMISVYGRYGMAHEADKLFHELGSKGFVPDAFTYNSLLHAFAKNNNMSKVKKICNEMKKNGFKRSEITYNTLINMYGRNGSLNIALDLYNDMKTNGCKPDIVTYTTLVDLLGKTGRVSEAGMLMTQMVQNGSKPTVETFNALICGYAKSGMRIEAENTFEYMVKCGVKPDRLVYLVIFDTILRENVEKNKIMGLYKSIVKDGFCLNEGLYKLLLELLVREKDEEKILEVIKDMENSNSLSLGSICDILVKSKCYNQGADILKRGILRGHKPNLEILSLILNEFEKLGKFEERDSLLGFIRGHVLSSDSLISESSIITLCENKEISLAIEEYNNMRLLNYRSKNISLYEYLISSCEKSGFLNEASQIFSDMSFLGIQVSQEIYKNIINIYCKLNFPETAENLLNQSKLNDISIYIKIIEKYGVLKNWKKAEKIVENLRYNKPNLDRNIWNALITAYSFSGLYEKSRAVFNQMIKNGPFPSIDSVNALITALIIDKRFDEIYVVIQDLQDLDFKINKSTMILMLDAFIKERNIFEVRKIYNGMKASGFFPKMNSYKGMIALLSRNKKIRDVELIVEEMDENGFELDISICNSLIGMYIKIGDYKKALWVYQRILKRGLNPNEETYNEIIIVYCRDKKPEMGLNILCEMRKFGFEPNLNSMKSLLASCIKSQLFERAEIIFEDIRSKNYKIDRLIYHLMLQMCRNLGNNKKTENLLHLMKEDKIKPNLATMKILMLSYDPEEAENILNNLKVSGVEVNSLPYSMVIDAYLKNGEYSVGIEKFFESKRDGIEVDHRIWTIFIRASSFCENIDQVFLLLNALEDSGFDLPIRLMKEKSGALVSEMENLLEEIKDFEDNAGFNFVNAILDLLWAFEQRATASWIFQLAIQQNIFEPNLFRVSEKDWGADLRKLSGGAALVALTLWLDHMQDAALQGSPKSPKSVDLMTGAAEYNQISLNKTLRAYLWEMGSPFLASKTRSGLLVAKAHSLKLWLKDSSFCLDLELKDASTLPRVNSMCLIDGYFMRAGLVPAFREIEERLGEIRPKKFARLALLSEESRDKVITRDIDGRREKLEKMRDRGGVVRKRKNRKFVREKDNVKNKN